MVVSAIPAIRLKYTDITDRQSKLDSGKRWSHFESGSLLRGWMARAPMESVAWSSVTGVPSTRLAVLLAALVDFRDFALGAADIDGIAGRVGGIDGDGGGASGNLVVVLGAVSGGIGSERRGADGCPPTGGWRGGSIGAQGEGRGAQGTFGAWPDRRGGGVRQRVCGGTRRPRKTHSLRCCTWSASASGIEVSRSFCFAPWPRAIDPVNP